MSLATYKGTVYPWHCDHMGHMNVMWYVGKFDEATWQFFNLLGLTPSSLRNASRGLVAVHQEINYRKELLAGDVISISTTLRDIREKTIRFEHTMVNDETQDVAATTVLTGVYIDTTLRKSCLFEPNLLERARELLEVSNAP
jgi:acyl-CoA thioester hydrolase